MRCSWVLIFAVCLISQLTFGAENTVKDFSLTLATESSLIHLADHAGKVVLVNWWRTSCAWSQKESPKLVELYKRHRDKGLVIVGISDVTADTVAQVPAYLGRYEITWPVGLNDQAEFMREIRPLGQGDTPGNYLVSRSGQVTYQGLDRKPEDWPKLEEAVVRALAEPVPATPAVKAQELPRAPSLALPDLQGKPVTLARFAGKPLVVNFFNAQTCDWTGGVMSKLSTDYGPRGLQVVGIDLFDDDAQTKACLAKYNVHYPVLRGDQTSQIAWIGDSKAWATFFVTADG